MSTEKRKSILEHFGFSHAAAEFLLGALHRDVPSYCPEARHCLFTSEIFVPEWIALADEAQRAGVVDTIGSMLFELHFPIQSGVSSRPDYQELALADGRPLRDVRPQLPGGLTWQKPDAMRLFLTDSGVGLLPVILTASREDFVTLIQAIVHHNEPRSVPASMGSCFINGYVNRGRLLRIRHAIATGAFQPEMRDPQLWRDKFIIISPGPYSGVPADAFGLSAEAWSETSIRIRIAHESCHYAVRRLFPRLKFGIQDELVADLVGLVEAYGEFKALPFLTFMGLENFPNYRSGGRLENYQKDLQFDAFNAAARLLREAAFNLQSFFHGWTTSRWEKNKQQVISALSYLSLEELAGPDFRQSLLERGRLAHA